MEYIMVGRKNLVMTYLLCLYGMLALEAVPMLFWMIFVGTFIEVVLFSGIIALVIGTIFTYIHKNTGDEVLASHYVLLWRTLISMAVYIIVPIITLYILSSFLIL